MPVSSPLTPKSVLRHRPLYVQRRELTLREQQKKNH